MINAATGLAPIQRSRLREALRAELSTIDGIAPIDLAPRSPQIDRLRRRGLRPKQMSTTYTLVDVNGVLIWEEGFGLRRSNLRRGNSPRSTLRGDIIERVQAQPLELGNEITAYLAMLDEKWTPLHGLREWNGTQLSSPLEKGHLVKSDGPVLVLLHGTFSNSENLLLEITRAPNSADFIRRVQKHYKRIFAFSHPTVSVSPMLNAVELARHFRGCKQPIDIVAHSRGGLVARWWLEVMEQNAAGPRRAVLVGCPLDGTSLATPKRLRDAMSWLTNVNQALAEAAGLASTLIPFLSVVSGLLRVAGSVTGVVASTPIVDAGVSLVPGLSAMTRVNLELARLNVVVQSRPDYFAVIGDFDPSPTGLAVWRFITEAKSRVADAAADVVFRGANDLVVDTVSMTHLCGTLGTAGAMNIKNIHDFGTQGEVHHTNYFRQPETLKFITSAFKI